MKKPPHLTVVPVAPLPASDVVAACDHGGVRGGSVSCGKSSGARFDPHAYRRAFPDRWMAFLRAHHRDTTEVAFFYGVTDRAARDWWEGVTMPKGAVVAMAAASEPAGFARIILGRAA